MRYQSKYPDDIGRAVEGRQPLPKVLEIHLSDFCQFACSYCHSIGHPNSIYGSNFRKPQTHDYRRVLKDFQSQGGLDVVFSGGGEPLLHPKFLEIAETSSSIGLRNHLYTNGVSSNLKKFSQRFLESFISIRISIHTEYVQKFSPIISRNVSALLECQLAVPGRIFLSYLIDTLPQDARSLYQLVSLIKNGLAGVEIRSSVLLDQEIAMRTDHRLIAILKACEVKNVNCDIRTDGINSAPEICYASYTTAVIDPFFNLRICCMRAHLSANDEACVCNLFETSLKSALAKSVSVQRALGGIKCPTCSSRMRNFSNLVLREKHNQDIN